MVTYRVLEKISKILKVRYKIIMQLVHNFKDTCSVLSTLELLPIALNSFGTFFCY
jgi:hypothetical protein